MKQKRTKSHVPLIQQRVINISIRAELLPWWDNEVEPLIRERDQTRTAFIMDAVRYYIHHQRGKTNGTNKNGRG